MRARSLRSRIVSLRSEKRPVRRRFHPSPAMPNIRWIPVFSISFMTSQLSLIRPLS